MILLIKREIFTSIKGDVEVTLTPNIMLQGRSEVRTDYTSKFIILGYKLDDVIIDEFIFGNNTDTINHITENIGFPKKATFENGTETGCILGN